MSRSTAKDFRIGEGKKMKTNNLVRNIKVLVLFFSICFLSLIVYIAYFNIFVGNKIINDPSNRRIKAAENEITRGSILDRNGNVIVYSKRDSQGNQTRVYNNGEKFAHIVGYDSYIYGKTGIEAGYNNYLQGKAAGYDVLGSIFKTIKETINGDEKKGNDIFLTIDGDLQEKAYKALGNNKGAVVALNPLTGEVLAMVSKPTFDPENIDDNFKKYNMDNKNTPFVNRASSGYYPPGSTFKIITASSALENISGITDKIFDCNGKLKIGNYTLKDHEGTSHGKVDIEKAFKLSCNYTFGSIGILLGFDRLEKTAESFMFNEDIESNDDVDVLKIKAGTIGTDPAKSKALTAQDAIGQNMVATNPMHMALVASAIANNGIMMEPYMVKMIKDRYGMKLEEKSPNILTKAVDSDIANTIKGYMIGVVKSGTGTNARISGITVAGKTGSAQDGNKTHSWFTCFAPAEKPEIAVAVIVENGGLGGNKAAIIARTLLKSYLKK
jgi:penicillin-binding protein A